MTVEYAIPCCICSRPIACDGHPDNYRHRGPFRCPACAAAKSPIVDSIKRPIKAAGVLTEDKFKEGCRMLFGDDKTPSCGDPDAVVKAAIAARGE